MSEVSNLNTWLKVTTGLLIRSIKDEILCNCVSKHLQLTFYDVAVLQPSIGVIWIMCACANIVVHGFAKGSKREKI